MVQNLSHVLSDVVSRKFCCRHYRASVWVEKKGLWIITYPSPRSALAHLGYPAASQSDPPRPRQRLYFQSPVYPGSNMPFDVSRSASCLVQGRSQHILKYGGSAYEVSSVSTQFCTKEAITYIAFIQDVVLKEGIQQALSRLDHVCFVRRRFEKVFLDLQGYSYLMFLLATPSESGGPEECTCYGHVSSSSSTGLLRQSRNR